ncbi:MAG TPA: hypothetical protein VK578_25115 [Edaphobacter sp.]|nr:hypothetical protein [Edaphobacter sp.]
MPGLSGRGEEEQATAKAKIQGSLHCFASVEMTFVEGRGSNSNGNGNGEIQRSLHYGGFAAFGRDDVVCGQMVRKALRMGSLIDAILQYSAWAG